MSNTSDPRTQVLKSYHAIEHYLEKLHNAMCVNDHLLGAWMQDFSQTNDLLLQALHPRERAFNGISQLAYLPGQAPREIIICAGFIGASAGTLDIVNKLNAAKIAFKQAILNLKSEKISIRDPFFDDQFNRNSSITQRDNQTASILKKSGLANLQLKQCYRQIPVLAHSASYISWTWAHTRSIKKITLAQAYDKLMQKTKKNHSISIELQLKKLATLSPNTPLAIVQELAPHLRTNIVLQQPDGEKKRLMIKGSLPIFYPADLSTPLPIFKAPTAKCDKNKERVIRSDVQLDPIVFLPSIRAHRYLKMPEMSEE